MKEHKWHTIAPEHTYDEDPAIWKWCIDCGAMNLGTDVFYTGSPTMSPQIDQGCPDAYLTFMPKQEVKDLEAKHAAAKMEAQRAIRDKQVEDALDCAEQVLSQYENKESIEKRVDPFELPPIEDNEKDPVADAVLFEMVYDGATMEDLEHYMNMMKSNG